MADSKKDINCLPTDFLSQQNIVFAANAWFFNTKIYFWSAVRGWDMGALKYDFVLCFL